MRWIKFCIIAIMLSGCCTKSQPVIAPELMQPVHQSQELKVLKEIRDILRAK